MEKILLEILTKINFIMNNTYINENDNLMHLYEENLDKSVERIDAIDLTDPVAIGAMKDLAFRIGFKTEGNYILVETEENIIYRIKKNLWIN